MIYQDLEISDYVIRTFSRDLDSTELRWHRDDEDRTVVALEKTDWRIQLENKLPQDLNTPIFIERGEWHRLIQGRGELRVKIVKA
jgi:hypothetical protein